MDRDRVLATLADMITPTGGLVIVNDNCLVRPVTDWQRAIEEIQARFLGTVRRAGSGVFVPPTESYELVLGGSRFRQAERIVYEFERQWTLDQVVGYLYSTSFPIRRLLGDRRASFEKEITETLRACCPDGRFVEPVHLAAIFALPPT
ncbi:hypothetical protein ND748_12680 [Frankia sp. AiPs1]|uniref:hypothetical protein n=1 Tax=Frankia sp. AiPs1 TaxID=573493 RepID=UPI002043B85E|nr:hypothetical protein [Frankia sp. AiPs1]MCM3922510.1 hypothetical protein [Frankia sp. AiPs1]